MDKPLNRRLTVALLAFLPLILLIWASFRIAPSSVAELSLERNPVLLSELARLPGSPDAVPAAQLALPAGSFDPRALNAAIPFIAGKIDPAPPYRFAGGITDRTNARDCLALAAMAEAGPSDPGQRAVMQVVLNRARHPAFANSVCGVVFEGAERATGCQFTFTCDGSLSRRYAPASWEAARKRADQALSGYVYRPVGNATHYHTDWVFPWWSPKLVKLARVETHLFLRWPGYWGSKAAGNIPYRGGEPDIRPLLDGPDPAATDAALPPPDLPADTPAVTGGQVQMRDTSGRANFVVIDAASSAEDAAAIARKLCKPGVTCRVLGWGSRADVPAAFPLPPAARASLQFSFTRDPAGGEIALYNCDRFPGLPRESCIPRAR